MPKGFDANYLAELKAKNDLVDVASGYVTLDRRGDNYWACCPFHHEKTPSFSIKRSEQFYHCFACGVSGDVFSFVKEMESCEFYDAVKLLAQRVGMPLPEAREDDEKTIELRRKKKACLDILLDTAHFYLDNLNGGRADAHIEYILSRKIPAGIVRKFGLGASLNYYDLPRYLLKKGHKSEDMLDSGVVQKSNDGRIIDSLGGRLIYPIINAYGEVIAFGGRLLTPKGHAKYKNTKETIVFNKSKSLYNINRIKLLKRKQPIKDIIIVEGYMDVISLVQAGFENVVASMGTSLTKDQARLLKRYCDNVLISYDGDFAGQKANIRGLEILKDEKLNVRVVPLPDGLDPDDVIKRDGKEGYQRCLDNAMPLIDFKLKTLKSEFDLTKTEDKRRYIQEALKVIATSESASEKDDLLSALREESGVTFEALKRDLLTYENGEEANQKTEPILPVRIDDSSATGYIKACRFVLAALLADSKYTKNTDVYSLNFEDESHVLISKYIASMRTIAEKPNVGELFDFFEDGCDELSKILDISIDDKADGAVNEKKYADCILYMKRYYIDKRMGELQVLADAEEDTEKRRSYIAELSALIAEKNKLDKNGGNI